MSEDRCTKCKGLIRPYHEAILDDNDKMAHKTCPTDLFGKPVDDEFVGGAPRDLFSTLGLEPDVR
ncbi:hypothetical protein [Paraburkholderia sp. C35]|uniref:hypothetical protein n=1 Tax=Paraburkholderia sp. C35 TaxID=2126993 RepID=UPI000D6982B1|nr:hypothetical protein [Paraburkholderia sp. C35]